MSYNKIIDGLQKHRLAAATFIAGTILLIITSAFLFINLKSTNQIVFTSESTSAASVLIFDIEGAVKQPGIYQLSENSRLAEVIEKAGGLTDNADRDYISKQINLAAKISDGGKLYVPLKGEMESRKSPIIFNSSAIQVNINTASQKDLEEISGIGPATAVKIIDNRPYNNIFDLLDKKIIGKSLFEKISSQITVF